MPEHGPSTKADGGRPLALTEEDVHQRLKFGEVTDWVEDGFARLGEGGTSVLPRNRVWFDGGALHVLGGAVTVYRLVATKLYTTIFRPEGERRSSLLVVFDTHSGDRIATIESYWLSIMRTAATTALATRYLARPDAATLTIIGTGPTALPQLTAVATERPFKRVIVHSRTSAHRQAFAAAASQRLGMVVEAVDSLEAAVHAGDVVITATDSREPIIEAAWLRAGTLINAMGSNYPDKRELSPDVLRHGERIFVDSVDAAKAEAGDLILAGSEGALDWGRVEQFGSLVQSMKRVSAQNSWFVFKSVGIGVQDIAVAAGLLGRIPRR